MHVNSISVPRADALISLTDQEVLVEFVFFGDATFEPHFVMACSVEVPAEVRLVTAANDLFATSVGTVFV